MWKTYDFRGFRVMVIQKWQDPFGQRMIRIETVDDGGERAMGLREEEFVAEAQHVE